MGDLDFDPAWPASSAIARGRRPARGHFEGGGRNSPSTKRPTADELTQTFNSWAFKREQPDTPDGLRRVAQAAIDADAPLSFVLYWGRGPRAYVATPERQCLDFLASLVRRIEARHAPGAEATIVCTDTHAALNGYSPVSTLRYFAQVEREAAERGFRTAYLGDLVAWAEDSVDLARVDEEPAPEVLERLVASAAKWYRGAGAVEDGARRYYRANMIEKRAVEAAFPRSIFVTFNGSEVRPLFPERMPIFYMYSIRRGVAVKPWFMKAEPAEGPSEAAPREAAG